MATRSVRDLRDLICVSRLTYRESDEEILSDSESSVLSRNFKQLSLDNDRTSNQDEIDNDVDFCGSRVSLGSSLAARSPDSGFVTNGSPPSTCGSQADQLATEASHTFSATSKSRQRRRKKKKASPTLPLRHELPKSSALPPVKGPLFDSRPSNSSSESALRAGTHSSQHKPSPPSALRCYDGMLTYIDINIVTGWLKRANDNVNEMTRFCNFEDNFVQFAHFWLTCFADLQKKSIFEMEYEIFLEEANLAFAVGRQSRKVSHTDITSLVGAVFKEYPGALLSSKGGHLFVDYVDVLSSDRTSEYKQLLSDVKCSTRNKQYAQWILAMRSFALVNIWSAILNFYRNLLGKVPVAGCLPLPSSMLANSTVHQQRMYQAIRAGYVDVVHYLIKSGHVNAQESDVHGRTWLFTAVMHGSLDVLTYLITRVQPTIDVNRSSDTGNTALHAAANQGNVTVTEVLLQCPDIHVNCANPQCENATPLHLAVMHGHKLVVKALLMARADLSAKMGDLTPLGIAENFGRREIAQLLQKAL